LGLAQLAQKAEEEDQDQNQEQEQAAAPPGTAGGQDPVAFSFRLAANLPLDDEQRQKLLAAESVVDRCVEVGVAIDAG